MMSTLKNRSSLVQGLVTDTSDLLVVFNIDHQLAKGAGYYIETPGKWWTSSSYGLKKYQAFTSEVNRKEYKHCWDYIGYKYFLFLNKELSKDGSDLVWWKGLVKYNKYNDDKLHITPWPCKCRRLKALLWGMQTAMTLWTILTHTDSAMSWNNLNKEKQQERLVVEFWNRFIYHYDS